MLCIHSKRKSRCLSCNGSEMCQVHLKRIDTCECRPKQCKINKYRRAIKVALETQDDMKCLAVFGCDYKTIIEHLKNKDETFSIKTHTIDHIKPYKMFKEEELDIANDITNIQPLSRIQNEKKSYKWSQEDELFWSLNIYGNTEYKKIYLPIEIV